jgi:hypothetical protein
MRVDDKRDTGFVSLKALKGTAPRSPEALLAEIRAIYFKTTKKTIDHDFDAAIELVKALPDEDMRQRAHVYMEGIAEMRREWAGAPAKSRRKNKPSKPRTPNLE